jgi:hypothetical protein
MFRSRHRIHHANNEAYSRLNDFLMRNEQPNLAKYSYLARDDQTSTNPAQEGSSLISSSVVKQMVMHSVEQTFVKLNDVEAIKGLESRWIDQSGTFKSTFPGPATHGVNHNRSVEPLSRDCTCYQQNDNLTLASRSSTTRICNWVSSYGSAFGCVYMHTSTLRSRQFTNVTKKGVQTVTSLVLYPASWLRRFGISYGVEASVINDHSGWRFHLSPVRAVPEGSQIFRLCQAGKTDFVKYLIADGQASVLDTSPKGWTPLHVRPALIFHYVFNAMG